MFVGIEADELAVLGHVDAGGVFAFEGVVGGGEAGRENIRHGDEFDGAGVDGEGVGSGPGAATAAADEGDLKDIGALGVDVGQSDAGESRDGGEAGRGADKFATRGLNGVHGWVEERRDAGVREAVFFTRGLRDRLGW